MKTIYYYPHIPGHVTDSLKLDIHGHPLFDMLYDLTPSSPPHKQFKSNMSMCPAMSVYEQHTYMIRSPVNFEIKYTGKTWVATNPNKMTAEISSLLMPEEEHKPYLQVGIYYLFWSEKKSNVKLYLTDPPLYEVNQTPTYYVTSGMIPTGTYTRNTSIGLVLKPDNDIISIQRGDALAAITLIGDERVKLVKKKPPTHILQENARNLGKPKYCPFLVTKQVFSKWLQ